MEVLPDECATTAAEFFRRAVAFFARYDITVKEVLSDNGACYLSGLWAMACSELDICHIRTKPYRPRTNGKAERFIQTLLRKWAYAASYQSSAHRNRALPRWIKFYNHERPHGSLGRRPPIAVLDD